MIHEGYWAVLTSPSHLLAELTVTAVTDGLLYPLVRLAVRRHDRREHPTPVATRANLHVVRGYTGDWFLFNGERYFAGPFPTLEVAVVELHRP